MRSPRDGLTGAAGIHEGEFSRRLLMGAYLLLIITCYTTTKAVRDSLFIVEVGPSQLPYLYVLSALGMAAISAVYPAALRRLGLFSLVGLTSGIAAVNLLGFWWLVASGGRAWFYILYVWVSLFGAIAASQAWSIATHVFDAREARRSFAWIGLGGILGGIAGGVLARIVAPRWGTETLLPVCAALMILTVILLQRLTRHKPGASPETPSPVGDKADESLVSTFRQIRQSRYLSMMVTLLLSGVVVEAFVDYEFKVLAKQAFDSKDDLTSFFGTLSSYGGFLALLMQTLVTGRLLKRFGVGYSILVFPSALLIGFLIVAARPALWAVSILKLIDTCLSYSVHRSGMELLYVPIPARRRAAVKALIDLLVDRAGRASGGILLLLLTAGLSFTIPSLSLVAATLLLVWLVIGFSVRSNYVQAFRIALEKKVIEPEALEIRNLDGTTHHALMQALSSENERQVLYALDLLGKTDPRRWSQHVPRLIEHPSAVVRSRTIAVLADWKSGSAALIGPLLNDGQLDVRVEAIRFLCVMSPQSHNTLREYLSHSDYRIVLAAIHCMAKYRLGDSGLIDGNLIEKAMGTTGDHCITAKTAAARALAITDLPNRTDFLDRLLQDPSAEVVQQAILASAEVQYEGAIPRLIPMLGRPRLRRTAREALLKLGTRAVLELRERLQDERVPMEVRIRIPKVLSFTAQQDVATFLLATLYRSTSPLDMALLKALNRMRSGSEDLRLETKPVIDLIRHESEKHQLLSLTLGTLESGGATRRGTDVSGALRLMEKAITERLDQGVERTFRLLALIYPHSDVYSAYFSLSTRPALKASAVEFLDNLIDEEVRPLVVPMVENREKLEAIDAAKDTETFWEETLQPLLSSDDAWLKTIARELAARLGVGDGLSSRIR
jgi:ATP:ADP antiporter, AAA family